MVLVEFSHTNLHKVPKWTRYLVMTQASEEYIANLIKSCGDPI